MPQWGIPPIETQTEKSQPESTKKLASQEASAADSTMLTDQPQQKNRSLFGYAKKRIRQGASAAQDFVADAQDTVTHLLTPVAPQKAANLGRSYAKAVETPIRQPEITDHNPFGGNVQILVPRLIRPSQKIHSLAYRIHNMYAIKWLQKKITSIVSLQK